MPDLRVRLSASQIAFLEDVATKIPHLLEAIRQGNQRSEYILGRRQINGRQVRLILIAEVVDAGANPLATHSGGKTVTSPASSADSGAALASTQPDSTAASRPSGTRKNS